MNDDARSPGAGSTPGPLSQQPPVLDTSDPGKCIQLYYKTAIEGEGKKFQFKDKAAKV